MPSSADHTPRIRKIGSLVNQLMSRRGYAQITSKAELAETVIAVVGAEIGAAIHVGNQRAGVLQIYASDSVTLQELNFKKRQILQRIQTSHPQSNVVELRFRIQS